MTSMTTALFSRDILRRVCDYQHGLCEDMRPCLLFPDRSSLDELLANDWDETDTLPPINPFEVMANIGGNFMSSWLTIHSVGRLSVLFECVERAREPILVWAAFMGRLDVLSWVHGQIDLRMCSDNLLAAAVDHINVLEYLGSVGYAINPTKAAQQAAICGRAASLEFLLAHFSVCHDWLDKDTIAAMSFRDHRVVWDVVQPQLVENPILLVHATTYSAAYNHLDTANRLLHILNGLQRQIDATDDVIDSALCIASASGNLEGLQWLFAFPTLPESERANFEVRCLSAAARAGQSIVANSLVPRITPDTLVDIYLCDDVDGSILAGAVDPRAQLDLFDVEREAAYWSVEKLCRVFDTFIALKAPGPLRTDALKVCLWSYVSTGQLEPLPWLVGCLAHSDVRYIVHTRKALENGFRSGGVPLLEYFEAMDIHLLPEVMDSALASELPHSSDKTTLPWWLTHDDDLDSRNLSDKERLMQWLVARRGGRIATLGHMLIQLARRRGFITTQLPPERSAVHQLKTLVREWMALADEGTKRSVLKACLQETSQPAVVQFFDSLLTTEPQLFSLLVITRPLATVEKLHSILVQSSSPDKHRQIESDALVEAALVGRFGVAKFLMKTMNGQNEEAVKRALEAATPFRNFTMLQILRNK
ncbi:Aste57867_889 [Aphanomyces stellatus]|uniref:Aste57867_889 protein n=1 Tax=Aphanomyces stellatus TaxID=120398 RepID=A0A485K715_9STRA|nr:hypothetical protein As57867_000888 [Aphanomyces stellatus]VFT78113.1 Aste57867_889 [Aphanomyces stellatus]